MTSGSRLPVLDGWRGISITFVLLGHLFPIGPKSWQMNDAVAATGMVIFFILSGFLITGLLLKDDHVGRFLIRRASRIVPLAWLASLVTLWWLGAPASNVVRHLLFIANWQPMALGAGTSHLWSLCVEVQFYIGIALLVLILRKKGLLLLPLFALGVTAFRAAHHVEIAINTYYRIDEILAGCILALLYYQKFALAAKFFNKLPPILLLPLLLLSSHPDGGFMNYLRPYVAMLLVGSTLFGRPGKALYAILESRALRYMATISYAVYVVHGCLRITWLDSGDKLVKYLKRPLFLGATLGLAHLSTFYFEKRFIDFGKRWTDSISETQRRHRNVADNSA